LSDFSLEPDAPQAIAVVLPDRGGDRAWDYLIPEEFTGRIQAGSRVRITLRNRRSLGVVLSTKNEIPVVSLRPIEEVVGDRPLITPDLMELAHWVADYYGSSLEAGLACVLPQAIRSGNIQQKMLKHVRLAKEPSQADINTLARRARRQAEALAALLSLPREWHAASQLAAEMGLSEQVFQALEKGGWTESAARPVARDPFKDEHYVPTQDLTLNPAQQAALGAINDAISQHDATPLVLHGVTGSGKTEVYLQAIRHALDSELDALVLVPEISLTPQTVERFKSRFQGAEVAVLHSHLSDGERRDEWYRIRSGSARIVIGARSAVFAPLARPGVIIVDEEHEGSYKQDETPRYNARDIAILRASRVKCAVVLGSATPSLESWHHSQTGKYRLLKLPERVDDREMPAIKILDLRRAERGASGEAMLTPALSNAIEGRLAQGEQSILFLNRRGFSTSMQCTACGEVQNCPSCSIALTFHRDANILACHICGYSRRAPKVCPACGDREIRHSGVGTQKVENAIARIFPHARVSRMDADSMSRKHAYRDTLGAFKRGEIDILVGTQMIAKGLDFPNVTLVGIINADLGLHVSDFRAGERTFQLLTQVAGRAGRGDVHGEVFIQTFTPFSPSIQFARHADYEGFAEQELEFRRVFQFPPFTRMLLITIRSQSEERADFCARTLAKKLKDSAPESILCGEAAPAPLAKAKSYYRFQVSLRGTSARAISRHATECLAKLPLPEDVFAVIDMDPVSLS